MTVLITGAKGFIGQHLIPALLQERDGPRSRIVAIDCLESVPDLLIPFFQVDLTDARDTEKIIRKLKPRRIYHLAGYTNSARSFQEPARAITENLAITINLLEAARRLKSSCRILMMSTIQVYGDARGIIREESRLNPKSPYAASKVMMEEAARYYQRNFGLDLIVARPGNQLGPGQSQEYVASGFAKQIVEIELGMRPAKLEVGNLQARRDFLDVRDSVQGYVLLMQKAKSGETCNLAGGKNISIAELLDRMLALSRLERTRLKISVSRARFRPEPEIEQRISIARIKKLGFRPRISLDQSLRDVLDYWRVKLSANILTATR